MKICGHPFWSSPVGSQIKVETNSREIIVNVFASEHISKRCYQAIVNLPLESPQISYHSRSSIVKILEREWLTYSEFQIKYTPTDEVDLSQYVSEGESSSSSNSSNSTRTSRSPRSPNGSPRILFSLRELNSPKSPRSGNNSPRHSPRFWRNSSRFK